MTPPKQLSAFGLSALEVPSFRPVEVLGVNVVFYCTIYFRSCGNTRTIGSPLGVSSLFLCLGTQAELTTMLEKKIEGLSEKGPAHVG